MTRPLPRLHLPSLRLPALPKPILPRPALPGTLKAAPLTVTALVTVLLLAVPTAVLLRMPRPRAEGLGRLLPHAGLLQSFPAAPEREPPALWRQRLDGATADLLWRQQRQLWWQFWSHDQAGGAYLVMPLPRQIRVGALTPPPHSLQIDGLLVVSSGPLAQRFLEDQLVQASRRQQGLQQRCLAMLEREPAAYWSSQGLEAMAGPLAPLLQALQEGCLALDLVPGELLVTGEAASASAARAAEPAITPEAREPEALELQSQEPQAPEPPRAEAGPESLPQDAAASAAAALDTASPDTAGPDPAAPEPQRSELPPAAESPPDDAPLPDDAPPPAGELALPEPIGEGLLLRLAGRSLDPLLAGLLSRPEVREATRTVYGLGDAELALLQGTPFELRLRPQLAGPFQAGLELALPLTDDPAAWVALLEALGERLRARGLMDDTLPPGPDGLVSITWRDEQAREVGGWRWQRFPDQPLQLLLFLGPEPDQPLAADGVLEFEPGAEPAGPGPIATADLPMLSLQARPRDLAALNLLPGQLPLPLLQARQLLVVADGGAAGGRVSRLLGRLQLGELLPPQQPVPPPTEEPRPALPDPEP